MSGLSPEFPMSFWDQPGYALNQTYNEVVVQNLRNLVMTSPGEKVMDSNFGVGIRRFLFEQNIAQTHAEISSRISEQVQIYMPFIEIEDIRILTNPENPSSIKIQIQFYIVPLDEEETLDLLISQ